MKSAVSFLAVAAAIVVAGGGVTDYALARTANSGPPAADMGPGGDYPMVLGDPFVVDGVTYTPSDALNYDAVGYAGQSGGPGITGTHRTLPLPSYVEVTSLESGHTILVRIDQRGPMTGSRLVDLSPKAWAQLGLAPGSHPAVRVRRVNPPEQERALLRIGQPVPERMETPPGLLTALKRKLGVAAPMAVLSPTVAPPKAMTVPNAVVPKPSIKGKVAVPTAAQAVLPKAAIPPKPIAAPAPEPKVAAKPAPKAEPVTPVSFVRRVFVQAAAFSSRERAQSVAKVLGGTVTAAGSVWRVRTGPFASDAAANAALAKVRAAGYADARVLHAP